MQEFWPHDPKWQLLQNPITLEEFEALPFVRSIFFHYGMRFDGHKMAVVDTDEKGGCKISIKVPEEHENDLVFYYQLRFADMKDLMFKGASLERFVFQTMVDNTVTFSVHVPTKADYFLEIFANKIDESSRIEENNSNMAPFKLKCTCKFRISCKTLTGKMHPLPNCAAGEWGPKKAMRHFGIASILSEGAAGEGEKVGIIMAEDSFKLRFQLPRPLQFLAKLRMNQVEEKVLDRFVHLTEEDDDQLTISVTLPQQGQYGLDIYAKPKTATETSTLSHACKYLVNCTHVANHVDLPKIQPEGLRKNKWGPTPVFDNFDLKLLSHKDPKIQMGGSGGNRCTVELHVPQKVQLSFQFLREPDEDNREYVTYVREPANSTTVKYHVTPAKAGNYMLCLYARYEDSQDRSFTNVYNYLVRYMSDSADVTAGQKRSSSIFGFFKKDKERGKDKEKTKDRDKFSDKSSDVSSDKSY